jgi:hypothetical protein
MKQLKQSRNDLFASLDRPALKGLPSERYEYAEWKRCTVAPDYHVEVGDHYYSVPFRLLRETAVLFDDPKWEGGVGATTIAWCNLWDRVASETGLSEEAP